MTDNDWADLSHIPEDIMSRADAEANAWFLVQTGEVKFRFNYEIDDFEFAVTDEGYDTCRRMCDKPGYE